MELLKRLFREEEGVTMIEYALLAALIAIAAVITIGTAGDEIDALFQRVVTELQGAPGAGS